MWHIDFMHTENIKCFYAETNDETSEQREKKNYYEVMFHLANACVWCQQTKNILLWSK